MAIRIGDRAQWLNYHHLYYFFVIAKEGTIAKAAQRLNVGQPALSTQLRQLEEAVGRALFERTRQRLVLTESGRIAYEYADEVFRLGAEMVDAIHDRLPNERVRVQIGALDSIPKQAILQLISGAHRIGPCSVSIVEGRGDELLRELATHEIDLLLSNHPPATAHGDLRARSVGRLAISVFGAPAFKALKKGFPQSLAGQPLVLPTQHSRLRLDLDHYFKLNGILPDLVAETEDTSVQLLLGASGLGLVPLPTLAAEALLKEKKLIEIGALSGVHEEIWLVSVARRIENPIASKLMKDFNLK